MRIALVVMPWFDVETPPLGVASLKAYLKPRGFQADVLTLNVVMAERVGSLAPLMTDTTRTVWPDWFFGYHLFGPGGLREVEGELSDVAQEPSFQDFLRRTRLPLERLEALLKEDVPAFLDQCVVGVPWERYDVIGFSSIMCSHAACLALARRLKERFPDKLIVFGGSNLEGEMGPATLQACEWVDAVISGEGEESFAQALERLRDGKPLDGVPGLSVRRDGRVVSWEPGPPLDLNALPTPDHDEYFAALRGSSVAGWIKPRVTFEGSRGCWWGAKQHCTFCGLNGAVLTSRVKSSELVLRDLVELQRRHGALDFQSTDNILAVEHLKTLLPALKRLREEEGVDLSIMFEVKSNLTRQQIDLLADAGCDRLQPGIESLDSAILKLMRKGVREIQNLQTLKFASERGMIVYWNYLYGFPGEDPAAYARMAKQALSLTHLVPATGVFPIRPDRFSPHQTRPQDWGLERPRPYRAYERIFPASRFDLMRAAYFFDFAPRPGDDAPAKYAAPLAAAVDHWQSVWSTTFFAYRQGQGFVDLFDSRPLKTGARGEFLETRLEGFDAFAFRFFRSFSPFSRLRQAAREAKAWPGDAPARKRLDSLVEARVLAREEDDYLALAVPLSSLQDRQRVALEHLVDVRKMWFRDRARRSPRPDRFTWV